MGAYWSSIRRAVGWTKEIQVILVGLDNAGKTSVLYRMQLGQVLSTMPTIGFSNERLTYGNMKVHALDIGGQTVVRQFWNSYYKHTDVVLFVIDGTDTDRMATCRNELMRLVNDQALVNATIAILLNKCDAAHYQPIEETKQTLNVGSIRQKHCRVFETSALTGDGLTEVLDWITERMRAHGYVSSFLPTMALSAQTLQFLRWIVDASSKQEANDLICAAVRQNTWRPHHAEKAVSMALGKSQWERAILIAETAAESGQTPEPQVYNKLVGALLTRWKSDAAWSCVFRRAQRSNIQLAEDVVTMLERHCAKNPDRTKLLTEYKKRHGMKKAG